MGSHNIAYDLAKSISDGQATSTDLTTIGVGLPATQTDNGYINVEGLSGADNDAKLVTAADSGKGIQLPAGDFEITNSFRIGGTNTSDADRGKSGGVLQGHGHSEYTNPDHVNAGAMSQLKWNSVSALPVIQCRSSEVVIRDLNINGNSVATHGVHFRKVVSGIGTGKVHMQGVIIHDCDVAIEAGHTDLDENADDLHIENVISYGCPVFFKSSIENSIDQHFHRVRTTGCTTMFEVTKGGPLYIRDCATADAVATTLIKVTGSYGPGNNNNSIYVDGFKVDNQKSYTFMLLDMSSSSAGTYRAYFKNVFMGYDGYSANNGRLIKLKGPTYCRLENVHNLQVGVLEYNDTINPEPTFHIDHCVLQQDSGKMSVTDLFSLDTSSGRCFIKATDNIDYVGQPVDDWHGVSQSLTGTHTGGSHATVLTDSTGVGGVANTLIGQTIYNTTDGSSGVVTANTATTATVTSLTGGSNNTFETSDAYVIGGFYSFSEATTARLEDETDPINVVHATLAAYKAVPVGHKVYNTTTGVTVFSDGTGQNDTWSTAAGVATHTPA